MTFENSGRYSVAVIEDYEPNSNDEVLKNYLGIKSQNIIEEIEQAELNRAELELMNLYDKDHKFMIQDIFDIHKLWLGHVYPMAGRIRTVNIEKSGFIFAAHTQIEKLLIDFEDNYLNKYTPCHFSDLQELAYALAIVHVELVLIHPFREGNGRMARLLSDIMAMQSNMPPLNYSAIDRLGKPEGFNRYIMAIHEGHGRNYMPMRDIYLKLLQESIIY